jgi:demethylmenaquinone methyltransferase/2-methoxy-6-polyprenyl-1,4-benzoquinol methylase
VSEIESAPKIDHARRVREMFGSIAGRYDLLNHLLSANTDKRWRRRLVARLVRILVDYQDPEPRVLDVACGTGDLAFTLVDSGQARVIGVDFCRPMLRLAKSKGASRNAAVPFIEGDALDLPFADCSFAAVTIGFGLRNLSDLDAGVRELYRVLKPGGSVVVLEFSKPVVPILRALYSFYFTRLLPLCGGLISGSQSAYQYLPDSVQRFPDQNELALLMSRAGFEDVSYENLTGGIAALHIGKRPR